MRIIGIDPGPEQSAMVCVFAPERNEQDDGTPGHICDNSRMYLNVELEPLLYHAAFPNANAPGERTVLVIEEVLPFATQPIAKTMMRSAYWAGRFHEAATRHLYAECVLLPNATARRLVCGGAQVKQAQAHQILRDRWPGGKGTKKKPGPLYGMSGDHIWDALMLVVAYIENPEKAEVMP